MKRELLINRILALFLVIFILLLGIYPVYARTETHNLTYNRAPRITMNLSNQNKLVINAKDLNNVYSIELSKYNLSKKKYQTINLKSNNIKIENYNSNTNIRKIEIPATFFKVDQVTIIEIKAIDKTSQPCKSIGTYFIKRLKNKNSKNNWFSVNLPATLTFPTDTYSSKSKNVQLKIADNNGLKSIAVTDLNNRGRSILNKQFDLNKDKAITTQLDLSRAKAVNKKYKLQFVIKSKNLTKKEIVYITDKNFSQTIKPKLSEAPKDEKIYFLDTQYKQDNKIYASDAIILESNGKFGMIDTGRKNTSNKVIEYLNKLNVNTLEFVLLTHSHIDHKGGYIDISNKFKIKKLYMKQSNNFANIEKEAKSKGTTIYYVNKRKYKFNTW